MGLSSAEFEAMTPRRFEAAQKACFKDEERRMRDGWERTRKLATVLLQPFAKKQIEAADVMTFPWDKREEETRVTAEESRERLADLLLRMRKKD